ncbi:MAG: FkbM family methyltransferase [Phycisphaeraceae bacterium]|nr:FkbM family methyltransferase [Phycisphaeraceae bacterium]
MKLLDTDPFVTMTRTLPRDAPLTLLDIGANEGAVARRMLDVFPNATVHAFEPAPDMFTRLAERAERTPGLVPHPLAVGDRNGQAMMHITRNHLLSSLLPASAEGFSAYGQWVERVRTVPVRCVRLDDWAIEAGVARVDALKIDVQGLELDVLRGATRLLGEGTTWIFSEAQLIPEYDGAASFSQIDLFLNSLGYSLHQMHEIYHKGPDQRSTACDALWVRRDALCEVKPPEFLDDERLYWQNRVRRALDLCKREGLTRVALYGAGQHTRALGDVLMSPAASVVCVIDDALGASGESLWGFPIVTRQRAMDMGLDAVILSANSHEPALWKASEPLRASGVRVIRLYSSDDPAGLEAACAAG